MRTRASGSPPPIMRAPDISWIRTDFIPCPDSLPVLADWLELASPQDPRSRSLFIRPEIDDEHVVEHRADEFAEVLVSRMIDVGVAVRLAFERQDEAVSTTFVAGFLAHVGPPFIVLNLFDLLFQIAEGVFDLFDLLVGRGLFEFKGDDVAEFCFGAG